MPHDMPTLSEVTSSDERLWLEYLPLDELLFHPRNPKAHDLPRLNTSYETFGYADPILKDEATGFIVDGNGRVEQLAARHAAGLPPPRRIVVAEDGRWLVPVIRGLHFDSPEQAEAYLIAANRLTELGGWHDESLAALLADLSANEDATLLAATGYTSGDLDLLLASLSDSPDFSPDPMDAQPRLDQLDGTYCEVCQKRLYDGR